MPFRILAQPVPAARLKNVSSSQPSASNYSRLTCLLPALAWPGALPGALPPLPALAWLTGRSECRHAPASTAGRWLEQQLGSSLPWGLLRRAGEAALPALPHGTQCLCADPASLGFAGRELLLRGPRELALSEEEAQALVASLNLEFAQLGHFEYASPERFYLHTAQAVVVNFTPLEDAIGRPAGHFAPRGADAARWQQAASAVQIFLHQHPLCRAREARQQLTPNTLWFWGAAEAPALRAPAACIISAAPELRGLARHSRCHLAADLAEALAADTGDILWHDDTLGRAAREGDFAVWCEALVALETRMFAPLARAVREGRIRELRLCAPGDRRSLVLQLGARSRLAFWRRPLKPAALASLLQDRNS